MFAVQEFSITGGYKKLTSVSINTGIGHTEDPWWMSDLEILVVKFFSENTHSPCAVAMGEISSLDHEIGNYSVENWVYVS